MSGNIAAQGGEGQIQIFELISNYDKGPIDISNGILELTYHESILDHTIRATATLADTGHRKLQEGVAVVEKDDVNLNTGELINLKFSDGYGQELYFSTKNNNKNPLRVLETRDIDESASNIVYTIDMTSTEYHDNDVLETRVAKRYDGKIPDNVISMLKDVLKTEKNIDVDPALNNFNFTGKNQKPFYLCTWLAKRCVPDMQDAKGNYAGYFFYETAEGFKFKSIDKLFEQKPKRTLIFNNIIGEVPPQYDGKIINYSFDSTFNLKRLRLTGAIGQAETRTFDQYTNKYGETNVVNSKVQYNESNTGGTERPKIGADQDKSTKAYIKRLDTGTLPSGKNLEEQLKRSKELNLNVDEIVIQSSMRYNSLFSIKLTISLAGDFSIRAGDVIHCDFPEITGKEDTTYSVKKSGIYMVVDVAHRITKNGCYTSLNLARESIGRKPIKR
jgi:hypothetical protein